jgi:ABC-2 type transport system permease protein
MTTAVKTLNDGIVVTRRNLIKSKRMPDSLVTTTMSPIMFVLLFVYVFGSAIKIPGVPYREYLRAGIFAQTMLFGAAFSGSGLAADVQRGIVDRFRSLPMAPSAVLVGRTTSDLVNNVLVVVIMSVTGLIVGWRIHTSPLEALAGFGILLLFAYAMSWVMAVLGLLVRSQEVFNNASFIAIMPLTFIANTFVQAEHLPAPLRVIAEWNPISSVTQAARVLFGNTSAAFPATGAWPMTHPIPATLLWVLVLLVVFIPLSVGQYKRAVRR